MAELRWNPFIKDWVMIASHRQERPQMPKDWCPFCPGSGKVPESYTVYAYDNDFPALSLTPPEPDPVADALFITAPSYGKCEVILYTPDHEGSLSTLPEKNLIELVDLWISRYKALSADSKVKYVFLFENRGEAVGVTMPHPHGQIYAYPYVPKKIQLEMEAMTDHSARTGNCLHCQHLSHEIKSGSRIIYRTDAFTIFLPFFADYPYGIEVIPNRHFSSIADMNHSEKKEFGRVVQIAAGTLDALFVYTIIKRDQHKVAFYNSE